MCIKMMFNITTFKNYFNIKQQSSAVQNCNYFCTNLILLLAPLKGETGFWLFTGSEP